MAPQCGPFSADPGGVGRGRLPLRSGGRKAEQYSLCLFRSCSPCVHVRRMRLRGLRLHSLAHPHTDRNSSRGQHTLYFQPHTGLPWWLRW